MHSFYYFSLWFIIGNLTPSFPDPILPCPGKLLPLMSRDHVCDLLPLRSSFLISPLNLAIRSCSLSHGGSR